MLSKSPRNKKTVPFRELYSEPSRNGLTKPKRVRGNGDKFLNMGELFRFDRISNAPMDRAPITEKERTTSLLRSGDILFARQSLVLEGAGKCSIFLGDDEPVTFDSHIIRVRLDRDLADPMFFYYFFFSKLGRTEMQSIVSQVAAAGIRGTDLANIRVPLPPISAQKAIASILGALDDKIDLNRRMNETLESMARALYKSWFVDFDPVVAKAAGKRPLGMDDATAALFPDRFVDAELGPIPEGWELSNVGSIAEFPRETMDPTELSPETPYVGLEHIPRRSLFLTDMGSAVDVSSGKLAFRDQDLLFGKLRPYFHKVVVAQSYGVCSTDIVVVRSIFPDDQAFVWFTLFADQFVDYATAVSGGTRMPRVRWQDMSQYPLVLPPDRIRRSFNQQVKRLIELGHNNVDESQTLAELRDLLLPKLISGEVRIKDAEKAVGEVV